ncbi:MAG: DsrE/DsrF/DrsH-like family protein [Promethearchaeota archaeon]
MVKKINFIVSDKSFEKFMMMVILGTTGSAQEIKMNFFFTFWGLNLLKKNAYKGLKVAGMPFPMKGMAASMFKKRLAKFGIEDPLALLRDAVEDGNLKLIPCSMTMELMGIKKEDLLDFVEEPVGAATFFEISEDADAIVSL